MYFVVYVCFECLSSELLLNRLQLSVDLITIAGKSHLFIQFSFEFNLHVDSTEECDLSN